MSYGFLIRKLNPHLITVPLPELQIISEFFSDPALLLSYALGYGLTFFGDPLVATLLTLYFESVYLLFRKYNQKPWLAIVPFANLWVLVRITGRPAWWNILLYIPFARWFFLYPVNRSIANDFRRTNLHALGMTLLPSVFYGPIAFHAIQSRRDHTVAQVEQIPL